MKIPTSLRGGKCWVMSDDRCCIDSERPPRSATRFCSAARITKQGSSTPTFGPDFGGQDSSIDENPWPELMC